MFWRFLVVFAGVVHFFLLSWLLGFPGFHLPLERPQGYLQKLFALPAFRKYHDFQTLGLSSSSNGKIALECRPSSSRWRKSDWIRSDRRGKNSCEFPGFQ
jgi:hypothetical protein